MEEANKERKKIKDAWNCIVIPLIVTVICAWLDIYAGAATGEYINGSLNFDDAVNVGSFVTSESKSTMEVFIVKSLNYGSQDWFPGVIRCAVGYLFPSLISLVIVMMWQQISMEENHMELYETRCLMR